MANSALWSGRFRESIADVALRFSSSIDVDGKLFAEDIAGSLAHVSMLGREGIIPVEDAVAIANGLKQIKSEIESGEFVFTDSMEDVHLAIERRLIDKIGASGGRLHTGRSRNDQVATDERLYLRDKIDEITQRIANFQIAIVEQAAANIDAIMPGYTHTQRAQPILLAHHLLAWVEMLERDRDRLNDCRRRTNLSPLGAAALAGTSFPIDRAAVALELGFDGIVANSIDAVSDRDYLIEFASAASILAMHLSRFAEEVVLWSTVEFGFVEVSDAFATGSSIMPQKKNPDMAELVRGSTGRVYGALVSLLTTMKGLPLAYNRDMQEDKAPVFDIVEIVTGSLDVFAGMMREITFNTERMQSEAAGGFSTATELADYLVRQGLPFRQAHEITGSIVADCIDRHCELDNLTLDELRSYHPSFDTDVLPCLIASGSVAIKRSAGSTAPHEVQRALSQWQHRLVPIP